MLVNISSQIMEYRRQWNDIFKYWKKIKIEFYLVKLFFKSESEDIVRR